MENGKLCSCFDDPMSMAMVYCSSHLMNIPAAYMYGTVMQHARSLSELDTSAAVSWWFGLKAAICGTACLAGAGYGVIYASFLTNHFIALASIPIFLSIYGVSMCFTGCTMRHSQRALRSRLGLERQDCRDFTTGCCCWSCLLCQQYRVAMALGGAQNNVATSVLPGQAVIPVASAVLVADNKDLAGTGSPASVEMEA